MNYSNNSSWKKPVKIEEKHNNTLAVHSVIYYNINLLPQLMSIEV